MSSLILLTCCSCIMFSVLVSDFGLVLPLRYPNLGCWMVKSLFHHTQTRHTQQPFIYLLTKLEKTWDKAQNKNGKFIFGRWSVCALMKSSIHLLWFCDFEFWVHHTRLVTKSQFGFFIFQFHSDQISSEARHDLCCFMFYKILKYKLISDFCLFFLSSDLLTSPTPVSLESLAIRNLHL